MRVIAVAGSACLLALSSLQADARTVLGAQNLSAQSSDGKFLVEAGSPENVKAGDRARGGFVYRLVNRETGEAVWERDQPESGESGVRPGDVEGLPARLWVDPAGRVVVWLMNDELVVLDGNSGEKVLRTQVGAGLHKDMDDEDRPLCWVSPQICRCYFLDVPSAGGITGDYFVVRTPLKGRLILDLGVRSVLTGPDVLPIVSEAADSAERDWVFRTLRSYSSLAPGSWRAEFELQTAVWIAASLQIKEVVEFLREFECSPFVSASGSSMDIFGTRQIVQLALRRLGAVPIGGPGVYLVCAGDFNTCEESGGRRLLAQRPLNRAENAGLVAEGMSQDELVQLVGHPDYVVYRSPVAAAFTDAADECCEYDMDGATSFTLRVRLDRVSRKVKLVEQISPALWAQGSTRELDLVPVRGR